MIALDAVSTKAKSTSKPVSWNHTVGATKGNRLLVIALCLYNVGNTTGVSSVTYAGQACTKACGGTTEERNQMIWYLINPPTGTNAISVTWSGKGIWGGAVSFYGVKNKAPVTASKTGSSAKANVDITVPTAKSVVVQTMAMETNSAITSNNTLIKAEYFSDTYEYGGACAYALDKTGASNVSFNNENKGWVSYAAAFGVNPTGGSFIYNLL